MRAPESVKVPKATFFGLVRAAMASGVRWVARRGEEALESVVPAQRPPVDERQLALWTLDAVGLPDRPWRMAGADRFECVALRCPMTARECVLRQKVSALQRNQDAYLGQGSQFPLCRTETCAQGRGVRAALDPRDEPEPRMHGPRGKFLRGRKDVELEEAAKARLRRVGLLDAPPSIDTPPVEEQEGEGNHAEEQGEDAGEAEAGGEAEARDGGEGPAGPAARPGAAARGRRAARGSR